MQRRGSASPKEIHGRDREISGIELLLDETSAGNGGVVFLKGEAGVGKTTLLRYAEKSAEEQGFQIMHGWCLPESLEPLLPIREALLSGGLEELYTGEENPRIEGLYLIDAGGVPMAKAEREEFAIDSDIFASMISAVGEFLKDSMSMMNLTREGGDARTMSYGDHRIVIETGEDMNIAALIKGRENEFLLADLLRLIGKIKAVTGGRWEGDRKDMEAAGRILRDFIMSGHYDGGTRGADDPRLRRSHLFENILMGLRRYSSKKPVLMVLDDLQWADPSTLSLIHYLARNIGGLRTCILGAYRPEDARERKHPLLETVRLMNREGLLREIEVERLGTEDTELVIGDALPGIDEEELAELSGAVYSITDGNPFFILETLNMMKETGLLEKTESGWSLKKSVENLEIPPRVYDIMIRKLDRLDDRERNMLEKGAVFGLEFRLEYLACLDNAEITEMAGTVMNMERKYGVIDRKGDAYRFDHSMIREIVYNEIPPVIRKAYHRRAAECMEEKASDGEVGLHFYLAGDPRGVEYLMRAAREAEKTYSNLEAIRDYEMAHAICTSEERKAHIMEKVGDLYSLTGANERAMQIYTEVFRQKERDEKKVAEAVALITKMAAILDKLGRYDSAMEWIEKGEELVRGTQMNITREQGNLLLSRGNILMRKGDLKGAKELFEKALEIFTENSHRADIPAAYLALGHIIKALGNYEEALEYMEKSAESSAKNGDFVTVARTYNSIGSLYGETGNEEKALEYYRKALATSEKIGDLWNISGAYNNIGLTFAMSGDAEKAVGYYEKALKIAKKIGELRGAALLYNNLGGLQYDMGRPEEAVKNYEEALNIARNIGARWEEILSMNNLGEALRTMENMEDADTLHEEGLRMSEEMGEKMLAVFHRCGLAEVHIERGGADRNTELIDRGIREAARALKDAEEIEIRDAAALAMRILGEGYIMKGDMKSAEEHLLKSIEIYREMERKTDAAISLYLLSLTGGDEEREELLREAEKSMGEKGWSRWKEILEKRWKNAGRDR